MCTYTLSAVPKQTFYYLLLHVRRRTYTTSFYSSKRTLFGCQKVKCHFHEPVPLNPVLWPNMSRKFICIIHTYIYYIAYICLGTYFILYE